jgi:hypothetical protein
MSRNLMLCVLVACVSAGCVTTRGGGTPGTGTEPQMCPTRPVPPPPPLPAPTLMSTLRQIPMEGVTHLIVAYCPETQHVEALGVDVRSNALPFRIQALGGEVQRFFEAAYRSGLPMAVFTRSVPLEKPRFPGASAPTSLKGTATASLFPEEEEPQTTTCDVCPGGQTGTGTGLGGTGGGAEPGWLYRYFPDVALRTAKAMETALKTRDVEFNEVAPAPQ